MTFIEGLPAWLFQEVPLYAFLIALLTSPAKWSQRVGDLLDRWRGS